MKLLFTIFVCAMQIVVFGQTKYTDNIGTENLPYIVGSERIPGYQIQIRTLLNNKAEQAKHFKNGKAAPVLQRYITNKKEYVGGILENEKNEKTKILNISLIEVGNTIQFIVIGKDFSRSFTLETGTILTETDKITVFHTQDVGIWKITKK